MITTTFHLACPPAVCCAYGDTHDCAVQVRTGGLALLADLKPVGPTFTQCSGTE